MARAAVDVGRAHPPTPFVSLSQDSWPPPDMTGKVRHKLAARPVAMDLDAVLAPPVHPGLSTVWSTGVPDLAVQPVLRLRPGPGLFGQIQTHHTPGIRSERAVIGAVGGSHQPLLIRILFLAGIREHEGPSGQYVHEPSNRVGVIVRNSGQH